MKLGCGTATDAGGKRLLQSPSSFHVILIWREIGVGAKPGLWTLDWTHGLDHGLGIGLTIGPKMCMRQAHVRTVNAKKFNY